MIEIKSGIVKVGYILTIYSPNKIWKDQCVPPRDDIKP